MQLSPENNFFLAPTVSRLLVAVLGLPCFWCNRYRWPNPPLFYHFELEKIHSKLQPRPRLTAVSPPAIAFETELFKSTLRRKSPGETTAPQGARNNHSSKTSPLERRLLDPKRLGRILIGISPQPLFIQHRKGRRPPWIIYTFQNLAMLGIA